MGQANGSLETAQRSTPLRLFVEAARRFFNLSQETLGRAVASVDRLVPAVGDLSEGELSRPEDAEASRSPEAEK